jgi:threonine/homoserine/homoserine lactone efflux protein
MLGVHNLAVFILAGLLLAMAPGPDTAYILGRSAQRGWRGGSVAAAGIALGIWVHILAATAGLSALLLASARTFAVVKLVGAGYLFYLGFRMILSSSNHANRKFPLQSALTDVSSKKIFWQGFFTNVLNPKVALFFLAFLPQFINSNAESKAISFLFLGLVFDVVGTFWNLLVAQAAARLASWAKESSKLSSWIDRTIGVIFIYVGFRLATAQQR